MVSDEYDELEPVLDEYEPDEIRVTVSHDGFRVYERTGETNRFGDPNEPRLWSWDPAHDREPYKALEALFEHVGADVEHL